MPCSWKIKADLVSANFATRHDPLNEGEPDTETNHAILAHQRDLSTNACSFRLPL